MSEGALWIVPPLAIAFVGGLIWVTHEPAPTPVHWEKMQSCLWAHHPETLEAVGGPVYPCSRNEIPGLEQDV